MESCKHNDTIRFSFEPHGDRGHKLYVARCTICNQVFSVLPDDYEKRFSEIQSTLREIKEIVNSIKNSV